MKGAVKNITGLLLACFSSMVLALGLGELDNLKNRLVQDPVLQDEDYRKAIDIKTFSDDWLKNPARAMMKYDKPTGYHGKLKRVYVRNGSDADLVFDDGSGGEITARLYPYQYGPWKRQDNGEWKPESALLTVQFAALYDAGQELFLSCVDAEPRQLVNCLVFPAEVIKSF